MEELTVLIAIAAFIVSTVTFFLSFVNASMSEYDNRMQLIISHLLSKDLATDGRPRKDLEKMLSNKPVARCECLCNERGHLVDKYHELYWAKKLRFWIFIIAFFALLVVFFFWLQNIGLLDFKSS